MTVDIKILEPTGRLDASRAQQFRREVDEVINTNPQLLLIDLKEVPFVDSSGIGALVSIFKAVRAANGDVALCSLAEGVRLLFRLTRLEKVFDIYDDRAAFMKAAQAKYGPF